MKIVAEEILLPQTADQKIPEIIFLFPQHLKRGVEKLRQNNEIDRDIVLSGRKDLLHGVLVQEEKLAGPQKHLVAVNDMGGLSLTHVDDFYVIMAVLRKMNEPGVGPDPDQFAVFQHLAAVDDHGAE